MGIAGSFVLLVLRSLLLFKRVEKWPLARTAGWGGGGVSARTRFGVEVVLRVLRMYTVLN